jgi:hypothetical protein
MLCNMLLYNNSCLRDYAERSLVVVVGPLATGRTCPVLGVPGQGTSIHTVATPVNYQIGYDDVLDEIDPSHLQDAPLPHPSQPQECKRHRSLDRYTGGTANLGKGNTRRR